MELQNSYNLINWMMSDNRIEKITIQFNYDKTISSSIVPFESSEIDEYHIDGYTHIDSIIKELKRWYDLHLLNIKNHD